MVSDKDHIALPYKVKRMYDAYRGAPKKFKAFKGEHASPRSPDTVEGAARFLFQIWNMKKPKDYSDALKPVKEVVKHPHFVNHLTLIGQEEKEY